MHGASWQEANALAQSLVGAIRCLPPPVRRPAGVGGARHAGRRTRSRRPEARRRGGVRRRRRAAVGRGGGAAAPRVARCPGRRRGNDRRRVVPRRRVRRTDGGTGAHRQRRDLARRQAGLRAGAAVFARASVRSVVVSDRDALAACERFLADHRMLVEPACGASLAVVYGQAPELEGLRSVVIEVVRRRHRHHRPDPGVGVRVRLTSDAAERRNQGTR